MRKNMHFVVSISACIGLLVLFSACTKSDRKPVYPVHGRIFDKNNRPAVDALVVFHPLNKSDLKPVKPLGRVDKNGEFALTTYENSDGGPEGEYVITIEWRRPSANPFGAKKEGEDLLLGRLSNPKTSKLRFTIVSRPDNTVPPIHLQ